MNAKTKITKDKIYKLILPDREKDKKGEHFWKDKSLLGYFWRAYFFILLILVCTIGLYTNVHTGETMPGVFPRLVIGNSALIYGLILYYHYTKIKNISYKKFKPEKIPSVYVGAVSTIATFFGVVSTVLISMLIFRGEVYDAIEEIAILLLMFSGWMFIILTSKFCDVCYFYYQWDKNRRK